MYQDINNAIDYIEEHLYENISLEEVANYIHYSVSHLSRNFSKYLGTSFKSYITKRRLSNAAIMVYSTNKPIEYISDIHGFNSSKYFSTLFKKELGISPRDYRDRKSFLYIYPKRRIEGGATKTMPKLEELVITANVSESECGKVTVEFNGAEFENKKVILNTSVDAKDNEKEVVIEMDVPEKD